MVPGLASRSCAPPVDTPPRPPVMVIPVLAVTELKFNNVDAVTAACFEASALNAVRLEHAKKVQV